METGLNIDKLPAEKRRQVINAGLITFSQNGYRKTSMADVAKAAHVSKASIFYYFGSKEKLYRYLTNFVFDEVVKKPLATETDFFKYLKQAVQYKLTVEQAHPGFFEFSQRVCNDPDTEQVVKLSAMKKERIAAFATLMTDKIDWSKFKPEVDPQKIVNIVMWVAEGCSRDYPAKEDEDRAYQKLAAYFDQLRQLTYKPEYLRKGMD